METARRVRGQFIALLEGIIGQLSHEGRLSVAHGGRHRRPRGGVPRDRPRVLDALLVRKEYGRADIVRDEAHAAAVLRGPPLGECRRRPSAATRDPEVQALTAQALSDRARHARRQRRPAGRSDAAAARRPPRAHRSRPPHRLRSPRRERRPARERRAPAPRSAAGPAPASRPAGGEIDLSAAARRAREHADAAFSHFKVGAALEAGDGTVDHRLQHRERHLRPDHLRRARRDVQGAVGRASRRSRASPSSPTPTRRRRRAAPAARSSGSSAATSRFMLANLHRGKRHAPAEGSAAAAVRRAAALKRFKVQRFTGSSGSRRTS